MTTCSLGGDLQYTGDIKERTILIGTEFPFEIDITSVEDCINVAYLNETFPHGGIVNVTE